MARIDDSEWQVESIRVSTFFAQPVSLSPFETWPLIVGSDPDQVIVRPKDAVAQTQGVFEGGLLTLNLTQDRSDWIFHGVPLPSNQANPPPPTLGNFPNGVPVLERLAKGWLDKCPPIVRLAFGVALVIPAGDLAAAYAKMQRFLPHIAPSDASARDFNYQVNRPQKSQYLADVTVNRVERWNIAQGGAISVNIDASSASMTATTSSTVACRLGLDVNNVVTGNVIPDDQRLLLLDELIEEGHKMVSRGEIA